jgi:hypothetical protein
MTPVYALYAAGKDADRAVGNLRRAGIRDADITVISAEPMEDYAFSELHAASWTWYIAAAGGAAGCAFATWLTRMTELSWPIVTGNMPIAPWWPNLIIMFELTMLGAILATVATLVVDGGLLRRRRGLYDPAISEGKILVGVEDAPEEAVPAIRRALDLSGS